MILRAAARSKYGAKATIIDGIRFASGKEGRRYVDLAMLQRGGLIADLELQPQYPIDVVEITAGAGAELIHCGVYTADFRYVDLETGEVVIEDVKSDATRTTDYRLRKRLIEAIHGITIREI